MNKMYSSGSKDGMIMENLILKFYEQDRAVRTPCKALSSINSMLSMSSYFGELPPLQT